MKRTSRLAATSLALALSLSLGLVSVGCVPEEIPEGKTYAITLPNDLEGGSVTADKTSVEEGGTVVVTATPDESYELDWIKFNGTDQTKTSDNKYEIENVREDITVTAQFVQMEGDSLFSSFPDDRFINTKTAITYYVNKNGTEEYRNDLPEVASGAELGIYVTMKAGTVQEQLEYLATDENYAITGGVKENYSENGFEEGVLTDISEGIVMELNGAYEISYTATKGGKSETRVQTVMVAKSYDLVSDLYGPTFDGTETVMNMEVVDAPSAMFGEDKVLKLYNKEGAAETSGFFEKKGIYLGTKSTTDFNWIIYNDSDTEVIIACKAGSNVMDPILAPHSYMLWNPYSNPYFQTGDAAGAIFNTHNYVDGETGELQMLQFTVVPTSQPMAEATIYIGGLRGTAVPYTEFATFPEDRVISSSEMSDPYGLTYYVNENGTEEFRSDFPTAKNASTTITAKVTARQFRNYVLANNAYPPTGIDEAQFDNGVLDDISEGIDMLPGYAYYIEYTATMESGATETRSQAIILYDLETRIPDVFTGATITWANQVKNARIEDAYSPVLGTKMINVTFGDHAGSQARRQVFWEKSDVAVAGDQSSQRLEFFIYNPNDFAISMFNIVGINSMWAYASIEPHTYLLWDPYVIPGYEHYLWGDGTPGNGDGLITAENKLGKIGFYFDAEGGAAGSLYIGEFMATLPQA